MFDDQRRRYDADWSFIVGLSMPKDNDVGVTKVYLESLIPVKPKSGYKLTKVSVTGYWLSDILRENDPSLSLGLVPKNMLSDLKYLTD